MNTTTLTLINLSPFGQGLSRRFRLTPVLFILLLSACGAPKPELVKPETVTTEEPVSAETELTAETAQLTEAQTQTLRRYIELSEQHEGPLRQQYLLEMAQWLYEQIELDAALKAVDKIKTEYLNSEQVINSKILKARILLAMGQQNEVLTLLPSTTKLSRTQQIAILEIRAQAFLDAGFPFESVRTRISLTPLLQDKLQLEDNQFAIWHSINLMSLNTLSQISMLPLDNTLKGWVELAKADKRAQNNWQQLDQAYLDWATEFPQHPAAGAFLASLPKLQSELVGQPEHIALLLPLTGQYAQASRVIRDGFLSAYYQSNSTANRPKISIINVSDNPANIWNHYQAAIEKGVDFIVGPLSKESIDTLSQARELQVPVLTLNYAEQQTAVTDNLFQFGLLPEDEAQQVAEIAYRQGRQHAAILIPNSPWGLRLQSAFQRRFEELGGKIHSIEKYFSNRDDFSHSIKDLLNLTQSNRRYKDLRKLLGKNLKFVPYRRQDIDMIFIAGTPRTARSIMPQLKFHQASDLPVYSTSHAFSGTINLRADSDINGLIYCDIPWTLNSNSIKTEIEKLWPADAEKYTRLYALGVDAYHLIPYLGRLKARSHERFSGQTGNLYLDPLLRIHRELVWAKFERGAPTPLEITEMPIMYSNQETAQE